MGKVFHGLDYQGRFPQAAEAATEVGADDPLEGAGVIVTPVVVLALIAVISMIVSVMQ